MYIIFFYKEYGIAFPFIGVCLCKRFASGDFIKQFFNLGKGILN
jgi:hypothetical protein